MTQAVFTPVLSCLNLLDAGFIGIYHQPSQLHKFILHSGSIASKTVARDGSTGEREGNSFEKNLDSLDEVEGVKEKWRWARVSGGRAVSYGSSGCVPWS